MHYYMRNFKWVNQMRYSTNYGAKNELFNNRKIDNYITNLIKNENEDLMENEIQNEIQNEIKNEFKNQFDSRLIIKNNGEIEYK